MQSCLRLSQEDVDSLREGLGEGWSTDVMGAEATNILQSMSFNGRRCFKKLLAVLCEKKAGRSHMSHILFGNQSLAGHAWIVALPAPYHACNNFSCPAFVHVRKNVEI